MRRRPERKVYEVLAETVLGRSLEDRMITVKAMVIKSTKRVGKYHTLTNRSIVVEFLHKDDVDYVINNRRYLPEGVYVDREYTRETEDRRRELRPYLKAARCLPVYQRKCRLDGDKLIILGTSYGINDLEKLPHELQGENISCISNQESYGFFGKLHPFSNFYPTKLNYQGYEYLSSEQMIQHSRLHTLVMRL